MGKNLYLYMATRVATNKSLFGQVLYHWDDILSGGRNNVDIFVVLNKSSDYSWPMRSLNTQIDRTYLQEVARSFSIQEE